MSEHAEHTERPSGTPEGMSMGVTLHLLEKASELQGDDLKIARALHEKLGALLGSTSTPENGPAEGVTHATHEAVQSLTISKENVVEREWIAIQKLQMVFEKMEAIEAAIARLEEDWDEDATILKNEISNLKRNLCNPKEFTKSDLEMNLGDILKCLWTSTQSAENPTLFETEFQTSLQAAFSTLGIEIYYPEVGATYDGSYVGLVSPIREQHSSQPHNTITKVPIPGLVKRSGDRLESHTLARIFIAR